MTYETKDSGARESFDTGAVRDSRIGKGRFDLVPPRPHKRVAQLYERGAAKYSEWNWAKGMPFSRFLDSAERHLNDYKSGDRSEDHLAAIAFNVYAIMHQEELAPELDDLPRFQPADTTPVAICGNWTPFKDGATELDATTGDPPPPGLFDTLFGRIMQTTGQPA